MVDEGTTPKRPNYSVLTSTTPSDLHVLFRGGCTALRTLDPARLLVAVRRHIDPRPRDEPAVAMFDGHAVVWGSAAVVLPPSASSFLVDNDRRLRSLGMVALDARAVAVDVACGELVVCDGAEVAGGSAAVWERHVIRGRTEPVVASGRYRVQQWWFDAPRDSAVLGRADSLHQALELLVGPPPRDVSQALDGVLADIDRPCTAAWPRTLVGSLFAGLEAR